MRALFSVLRQMRPNPWRLLLSAFTGAAAVAAIADAWLAAA